MIRLEPQPIALESDSDDSPPLPPPPLPPNTLPQENPVSPPPPPSQQFPPMPPSPPQPPPPKSPPYSQTTYPSQPAPQYSSSNYPLYQNCSGFQAAPAPPVPPQPSYPISQFPTNYYPQAVNNFPPRPAYTSTYSSGLPYTAPYPPLIKSEPGGVTNGMTSSVVVKQESGPEPAVTVKQNPSPVKLETRSPKPRSFCISPPPMIRGVATSDRLTSNILLDEVKKGFKQLVEDAVRTALKVAWSAKKITKEEYKDIFKKSVEKVTGSKETVVNQGKIKLLVDAYIVKARKSRQPN